MSMLDQLRKQAEEIRAQKTTEQTSKEELAAATERAMNSVNAYFIDLAKQLDVIRPASDRSFLIDSTCVLRDLAMENFHVVARRRGLKQEDHWNFIQLSFSYANPQPLTISKDFEAIEHFEHLLNGCGVKYQIANERERYNNRTRPAQFLIERRVPAEVVVTCDPAIGDIAFTICNVERFSAFLLAFPAQRIDQSLLDELTKFLLGHANSFRSSGRFQPVAR